MINLFERFSSKYIPELIKLRKIYFVSQTYTGATKHVVENKKITLLISDYDDKGLATVHKAAVKDDKYAAIIDLTNQTHLDKLYEMLRVNSEYVIYWAVIRNREKFKKKVDLMYKENIKNYITKHTKWQLRRDENITRHMQLVFGELFMILKRNGDEEIRVKFEDIEKA